MIIQDGGKSKRIGNPGLTFWNIPFVRRLQISENGFLRRFTPCARVHDLLETPRRSQLRLFLPLCFLTAPTRNMMFSMA